MLMVSIILRNEIKTENPITINVDKLYAVKKSKASFSLFFVVKPGLSLVFYTFCIILLFNFILHGHMHTTCVDFIF